MKHSFGDGPLTARLRKRLRLGWFAAVVFLAAAALLAGLNVLITGEEKARGWQIDLSFNRVTTFGETTRDMLRELDKPVHPMSFTGTTRSFCPCWTATPPPRRISPGRPWIPT